MQDRQETEAGSSYWRAQGWPSEHVACGTPRDFSRTAFLAWGKYPGVPNAGFPQIYTFV